MANSQRIVVASRSSQRIEELGVAISEGKGKEPGPGKNVVAQSIGQSLINQATTEKGQPEMRQAKTMGLLNENASKTRT